MPMTISPNMSLQIPGVGTEAGPNYATEINNSLSIIDNHNHTTGAGALIPVAGLDINADLSLGQHNLTNARTLRLFTQTVSPSGPSDIGVLYRLSQDLYYIDGNSNVVRITQGGAVTGTPGSINGLPSGTASASYGGATFVFQSFTNTSAVIDAGSYIMRNNVAGSVGLTLSPPNAMSADYSLTLPALPISQKFLTLDASGNITAPYDVDNSTITISSNLIKVVNGGITNTQIASGTITGDRIASETITSANILNGTITSSDIGTGQVLTSNIGFQTITSANIGVQAIVSGNILNNTITNTQISTNTLDFGLYNPGNAAISPSYFTAISPSTASYSRVGGAVTVSGSVQITINTVSAQGTGVFYITPPIASSMTYCNGSGSLTTPFGFDPLYPYGVGAGAVYINGVGVNAIGFYVAKPAGYAYSGTQTIYYTLQYYVT